MKKYWTFFPIFYVMLVVVSLSFFVSAETQESISGVTFHGGEYISDSIPDTLNSGEKIQFMIEFRNTGMAAWENDVQKFGVEYSGDSSLVTIDPIISLLPKGSRVHNGQSYQFPFLITPYQPGYADLNFAVVRVLPSGKTTMISGLITIPIDVGDSDLSAQDKTGTIQVSSGPLHLPVELDGNNAGATPIILPKVTIGYHTIKIEGKDGVMEKQVLVPANSVVEVTYYVDKSTPLIETKESLLEDPNPFIALILSNFFIILGFVLALTFAGIFAVIVITRRLKRAKIMVSQTVPPSFTKKSSRTFSVEAKGRKNENIVRFDSIPGLFKQEDEKFVKVKVTNQGLKSIIVDDHQVNPGEFHIVLREISDDNPGDNSVDTIIAYTDGDGKENTQKIRLHYSILPEKTNLTWIFDKFFIRNGKVIAVIKIRNGNPYDLDVNSVLISAENEGTVEMEMDDPDDELSVFKRISIMVKDGVTFSIPVRIPYNKGVMLYFSHHYSDSLNWFNEKIAERNNDPTLERYCELIRKKIAGNKEKSPDISVNGEQSEVKKSEQSVLKNTDSRTNNDTEIISSNFPESLRSLYHPLELINADRMGNMYRAVRLSDSEGVAVRILEPGQISLSSVELQIQAWRSLKHQNILHINFWERDPVYFLEFDPPSGAVQSKQRVYSLADLKVPIPPRAALHIVRGLAEGLAYTHGQGVRHYLLEPSVILLDKGLNPKISGFDTALMVQSHIPDQCWILAPEQCDPGKYGNPGKKTDIYQVGAIFYYLITGQIPFDSYQSDLLPSRINPKYCTFDTIISNSLSPDKNGRYAEIVDMMRELESLEYELTSKKNGDSSQV